MTVVHTELGYAELPYADPRWPYANPVKVGNMGWQTQVFANKATAHTGWQTEVISTTAVAWQTTVALYNTTNLRILCEFPSRGAKTGTGTNAWGNDIAKGENWVASSTEPSATDDFSVFNLNTDIVEQIWRSATGIKSSITLDCDVEVTQGVFLDTFAILGHNLTSSAVVTLIGRNASDFSGSGVDIPINVEENEAAVYIAPDIPNTGYRYWRIAINDATNSNDHIAIGTVLFGAGIIFQGECFVDRVKFGEVNFTDEVFTEAHTTVQNDRGLKKRLGLEFRNLDFQKANYTKLKNVFRDARTIQKCLWIPTPQFPTRFLVFAKLTKIPMETHNVKGENNDYVTFPIDLDESR